MKITKHLVVLTLLIGTCASFWAVAEMSPREKIIENRITPVGDVYLDGQQPAPSGGASADLSPEEVYNKYCVLCHKAGVSGAPVFGDKAAWKPRIAKGISTLVNSALHGFNAMPPKGTCASCTDDQIKATVEYMVNKSK